MEASSALGTTAGGGNAADLRRGANGAAVMIEIFRRGGPAHIRIGEDRRTERRPPP